jgi:hypothetical protein
VKNQTSLVSGFLSICAIALLSGCAPAQKMKVPLVLQSNPTTNTIYPKEKFDKNAAVAALQKGHSTIQGKVCAYNEATRWIYWNSLEVWLYPATPYLEAWYKLRESSYFSKVYMDPEAIKVRLETTANKDGEYAFHNLRPGKYFLQSYMNFDMVTTESVYDGEELTAGGMTRYYHDESYNWKARAVMDVFVTVEHDGDKVSIDVTNRPTLFGMDRGCR